MPAFLSLALIISKFFSVTLLPNGLSSSTYKTAKSMSPADTPPCNCASAYSFQPEPSGLQTASASGVPKGAGSKVGLPRLSPPV